MQSSLAAKRTRPSPCAGAAPTAGGGARFGGLDALRGLAVIGGVLLHACVAYMPSRMPNLLWPVHDAETTPVCHVVFWWLHCFRLPLFFFISGFFAEMMCEVRGANAFLKHRIQRIAIPYHVFLVTLMPFTLAIWIGGLFISERCTLDQVFSFTVPFDPEVQDHYFGPGHLWFLADLVIISVTFALLRREFRSQNAEKLLAKFALRHRAWSPLWLAIPSMLLLWGNPSPYVGHNNTFIPDTARLSYYGLYFVAGAIAFRRKGEFLELVRYPWLHLPLSLLATAAALIFLPGELSGRSTTFNRFLLSLSVTLAAWLSICGLMAVFLRNWKQNHRIFRYLADASYWVYVVHLPLVGLANIALREWPIGAFAKFLATSFITLSVAFLSYQACVRYTWIGRALHGLRARDAGGDEPSDQRDRNRDGAGQIRISDDAGQPAPDLPPAAAA